MSGSASGAQSLHQLDFYQAMADFKLMFPNMDEEVIEAVLRANGGAVDGTIDQLLTMNTDFEPQVGLISSDGQHPMNAKLKRVVKLSGRGRFATSEASSGSFGDDLGSNISKSSFGRHVISTSSAKGSVGSETGILLPKKIESCELSSVSTNISQDLLLDVTTDDSRVFSNSISVNEGACGGDDFTPSLQSWDSGYLPPTPAPPIPPRSPLLVAPPLPPKMGLFGSAPSNFGRSSSESKPKARHWDPPLLGKLPDDFLRLDVGPATFKSSHGAGVPTMHSAEDARQPRNSCHDTSPLASTRIRPDRLNSDTGQTGNHSSAGRRHRRSHDGGVSTVHSCECQRRSSGALDQNPNSKRHVEIDAGTWQMLEDERLALVLQSEEFLAELRQNEDFMRSLEHERQLLSSGENSHGLLPVTGKSTHSEDSAEFRTLLKHIGDSSKKKLVAAAQKFFAKCKKKSPKQVLKETAAPSTTNLLDEEETEHVESVDDFIHFPDEQYHLGRTHQQCRPTHR